MLPARKKRIVIVTISMLSLLLLILFQNTQISRADDDKSLEVENLNFQMQEFSDDKGNMENISSIDIQLPSSNWNVKDLELNFSNIIYYEREIKTIEDTPSGSKIIEQEGLQGLGVQFMLNDTTTIFGVDLRVVISSNPQDSIDVRICGYNSSINAPNNSIYASEQISPVLGDWYYHEFSSPIKLPKGNFSVVLYATSFQNKNSKHYWYYNDTNSNNPDLYISENDGSGWTNGIQGSPFLYKLDQKVKRRDFYPEKYNMTAEINGNHHKILNNNGAGKGNLKLSSLDFSPSGDNLHIPINNNKSDELYFDLNFNISLENTFSPDGSLIIKNNINEWTINPQINRIGLNYTVKFNYPDTWENISVTKNGVPTYFTDNGEELVLLNETISPNAEFRIEANSIKFDPILKIQKLEYSVGEEILIEVLSPLNGRYTFILYASGIEKYRDEKTFPSETIIFSYNLTSTAISGNWTAFIYWNNETDAGIQTQEFKIFGISPQVISGGGDGGGSGSGGKESSELDPLLGVFIIISLVVGAGGSLATYKTVKSVKKKRDTHWNTLYNKFKDNLSLNYLMISDNKSGLNVYEQFFAGKSLDPSLLSGFLEAIRNFGIELTGSYQKSETVKLEYQDSKILMNESEDFRLILIMSDNPSKAFINSITNLAKEIEKLYGHLLKDFRGGDITMFSGIKKLVEKHLNVTFTYPLRIVEGKGLKLTRAEKLIIQRARVIMKQTNLKYFYTTFLMPDQEYDPMKTKIIFNLIDKGIFQPIDLSIEKNNNKLKYK